jgi:cell division protein FtsL
MLLTPILGRLERKDELFDKMRWSKKRESDQSREKERFFFICSDKTFLDSINSRSLTVVFKTGYRQKRVTDPNKEVTDPSTDVTDPNKDVTDPNKEVADPSTDVTDPNKEVADPSTDVTDPNKEVADPSTDVTDANTEIYRLQDSILSV